MNPKQILGLVLILGPFACATDGQSSAGCAGGCAGEVEYPRDNPGALPTEKSMRLRITETGFDSIAAALPTLLASGCRQSDGDLSAACELDPENPRYARFYIGEPCAPIEGSLDLLFTEIATSIRSGPCNNVDYHRSAIGLHLDSFEGNIHLNLIQDSMGDGIEVVLGCHEDSGCTDADNVNISLDMVWNLAGFGANNSCEIRDDNENNAGVVVQSFKMILRPRIERDETDRPYLVLEPDQVDADDVELDFNFGLYEASSDPACPNSCAFLCTATGGMSNAVEFFLEQELIATVLADLIADAVGGGLTDTGIEATGQMEVPVMLGVDDRASNPALFSVAPNEDSPDVTGASGQLGLNFDLDTGFFGVHSNCIPNVAAPSWLLPEPIDPGSMVQAPDPVTGSLEWEPFDIALLLGDSSVGRLAYALFDSGNLCIPLTPDAMADATGGAFTPSIQLLSFVAPGLGRLAAPQAPVLLALAPNYPPHIQFGDGSGEGEARNSHIQISWPNLELELYPMMDDTYQRVLAFSLDVDVGLSLEAAPNGNLKLMIDRIRLGNAYVTYNEIGTPFAPQAIEDLVETFLPLILEAGPFTEIALNSEQLGIPFVPKVRSIQQAGEEGRYLALYIKLCTEASIGDATDLLCYEDPVTSSGQVEARILGAGGPESRPGIITLKLDDSHLSRGKVELAYRVDGMAWRNFRPADSLSPTEFTINDGALRWPGAHRIEVMTRTTTSPNQWSEPTEIMYFSQEIEPPLEVGDDLVWSNARVGRGGEEAFNAPLVGSVSSASSESVGCGAVPTSFWLLFLLPLMVKRRRSL